MPAIVVVEDDERIIRFLVQGLQDSGYLASSCRGAEDALELLKTERFDLMILDRMLPRMSGSELCLRLRRDGVEIPILMLTAMDSVRDRVDGLRTGADDYLTKPFAFDELLARVEALLRRGRPRPNATDRLTLADLTLDLDTMTARRGGRTLALTPKEFRLLELLMRRRGRVLSRAEIIESLWNAGDNPSTNVVDVYISHLRQKVDDGTAPPLIQTVRGFGYRIAAVDSDDAA